MSTMCTVTTLAACDHIPDDKMEFISQMCVLALTRGDGTLFDAASIKEEDIELFDAASIKEEDIVELCV